jgi:hypothetical protein
MKLDIFQMFIAFIFQHFNKFVGLKMLLGIMSKIVMHGSKKKFNFEKENQPIQV